MRSATKAIGVGIGRVLRAPLMLLGLWAFSFAAVLPAAWIVADQLRDSFGDSRIQDNLRTGFDMEWYGEFNPGRDSFGDTLRPSISGVGAIFDNLEDWISGDLFTDYPVMVAMGVGYALAWLLLTGGVLERYARPGRPAGVRTFFGAGGRYFFRFVRLAMFSGVLYWLVYGLSRLLFDKLEEATRDVTVESTVVLYSLSIWGLVALLLTLIHMVFGYAKIATVVEHRRSMLLATARGLMFVLRHPASTFGVYYGLLSISAVLLAVYAVAAPDASQASLQAVLWAFAASQLFLLAKMLMRLWLVGSQVALYGSLADSRSAAAPAVVNPD